MENITLNSSFEERNLTVADFAKAGDKAVKTAMYNTESTSGVVWVMKPGQEIAPHRHMKADDIWICIQGEGIFYPEPGVEKPIRAGQVIVNPKGSCHGMKNTGVEDFVFVGILAPVPADFQAI